MRSAFISTVRAGMLGAAIGLLGAVIPGTSWSQAMRDPSRPPAQFLDPADAAEVATSPVSGLQTIKRTGKRRVALLHGGWVRAGDRTGEAVVEKIDDQSVVLKYQDGRRETISLYPEVEMRSSKVVRRAAGK